jgi:hypothetical protein
VSRRAVVAGRMRAGRLWSATASCCVSACGSGSRGLARRPWRARTRVRARRHATRQWACTAAVSECHGERLWRRLRAGRSWSGTASCCVSAYRSGSRGLARRPWRARTRVHAHRHTTCPLGTVNTLSCLRVCWDSASGAATRLELNFQRRQSRSSVLTDQPQMNWTPVLQYVLL